MTAPELQKHLSSLTAIQQVRLKNAFENGDTDFILINDTVFVGVNMSHLAREKACTIHYECGVWSTGVLNR